MEWHTVILPPMSAAIGACGLSRNGLVMVLVALHHSLPAQAERLRKTRAPDRPESYFLFRLGFADDGSWHRLAFWVDDVTAPERLFVEKLVHQARPII